MLAKVGIEGPLWFSSPTWAKPALVLLALWGIGDLMIIFVAALLDVPTELYEAASLDGAGAWQQFRNVTLPSISPVVLFAAVTGVIATLQYFTQAAVAASVASGDAVTGGGISGTFGYPEGSTFTYPLWLYTVGLPQRPARLLQRAGRRALRRRHLGDTGAAAPVQRLRREYPMTAVPVSLELGPRPRRQPSGDGAATRSNVLIFVAEHSIAIALSLMFLAPIVFLLLTSFMSNEQQLTADMWPRTWHPENYAKVFERTPLPSYLLNTVIYAV